MKTKMFAIGAIASTLIGGGALVASNAFAQATPPPQTGGGTAPQKLERHPEIRKALRQLNMALKTMQNANDDFKGHKEAAMDDTQKGIKELQAALAADKH
jgi:hypothetical protein